MDNEVQDGPYERFHDNGQLEQKASFKDGVLNGPYEIYNKNGQLEEKGSYKDGEFK